MTLSTLAAGPDLVEMAKLGGILLLFLLLVALFYWAITKLPLPPLIKTIATVALVVIAALVIIIKFLLPLVQ